ncbi:hypothetical protein [Nonomuraea gerenzanensis]|uniref:Uncharacterized protein n=1 Tax=Nonomuraea gerenzanensis TaxID=93944 RepID=A0A1M4ED32_9ACTN|nr:hypothetical protein [Nonomuraea gerenzanensis]UBU08490.1 hypothetical protein LCN96_29290 [Nonomuraea gerenzanensis]SBO96835.1 hypothetical protein BN4615_P6351 [Nonomuraea gerenzanensis]
MTESHHARRRFLRAAAGMAAAVVTAGTEALLPDDASAAPLPPTGVDIPCSMYAADVPLKLNILGALTLDFKGGINLLVRTSRPEGLVMEVRGFRVEADTSPSTPGSGTLFALALSEATLTPLSVMQASGGGGGELLVHLSLTMTVIDKATGETITAPATGPTKYATLRQSDVSSFPPVNASWRLHEPVQLLDPAGQVAGELQGFDAVVNGA